jgi:hypothetical protein
MILYLHEKGALGFDRVYYIVVAELFWIVKRTFGVLEGNSGLKLEETFYVSFELELDDFSSFDCFPGAPADLNLPS